MRTRRETGDESIHGPDAERDWRFAVITDTMDTGGLAGSGLCPEFTPVPDPLVVVGSKIR